MCRMISGRLSHSDSGMDSIVKTEPQNNGQNIIVDESINIIEANEFAIDQQDINLRDHVAWYISCKHSERNASLVEREKFLREINSEKKLRGDLQLELVEKKKENDRLNELNRSLNTELGKSKDREKTIARLLETEKRKKNAYSVNPNANSNFVVFPIAVMDV